MKAAIVDAKDLRDELKAADARLRTKPTGIRPRDLMLPVRCWRGVAVTDPGGSPRNVFVLALLAVPILAIILPVFIKAGADKEILADGKLYACALSEIPRQVSAAWGSQNRRGNLPFDAITYAKSQRPKNTASRVVKEYLARHKQQCELVSLRFAPGWVTGLALFQLDMLMMPYGGSSASQALALVDRPAVHARYMLAARRGFSIRCRCSCICYDCSFTKFAECLISIMQIARLAFADQPVNWPDLDDWSTAARKFSSKFGVNMPPPVPPPSPTNQDALDEDDYSSYLEYYNGYLYDENGGYMYDYDEEDAPQASPPPPVFGRRMLHGNSGHLQDFWSGLEKQAVGQSVASAPSVASQHMGFGVHEGNDIEDKHLSDDGLDSAGLSDGHRHILEEEIVGADVHRHGRLPHSHRRRLLSKRKSAKKRYEIFQQLAQRKVKGYAGYLLISSELARLEPSATSAVFGVTIVAKSDNPYPYGVVNQRRVALEIPKNVSLGVNVLSAESGRIELRPGDVSASKRIDIDTQSLYYYPFDSYKATLRIDATLSNGYLHWQMPILVQQVTSAVGWQTVMVESVSPADAFINGKGGNNDGSSYLVYVVCIPGVLCLPFASTCCSERMLAFIMRTLCAAVFAMFDLAACKCSCFIWLDDRATCLLALAMKPNSFLSFLPILPCMLPAKPHR
eukprot:366164-Chlamydomonas_euryale.AAC.7